MSIPIGPYNPEQYNIPYNQATVAIPFAFFENEDVTIYRRSINAVADDATDILTFGVDYTLTGAGSQDGGVATFLTFPIGTDNQIVTPIRTMTEERMNLYIEGGFFTLGQLNDDFSRDVMMNQQNQYAVESKTPHYQDSAVVIAKDLELPQLAASQLWRMNAENTEIEAVSLSVGDVTLPVTNNHLARFDGTAGVLKDSEIVVTGSHMSGMDTITFNPDGSLDLTSAADEFETHIARSPTDQSQDLTIYTPNVYFSESSLSMVSNTVGLANGIIQTSYANIPGKNRLLNGSFSIWEEGTSFTLTSTDNFTYCAQMWQIGIGSVGTTIVVSQQAGPTSDSFWHRLQREAANTGTATVQMAQSLTRSQALGFAGAPLSIRFKAKKGADFSAAGSKIRCLIVYGTGTTDVSVFTGFTGNTTLASYDFDLTTNSVNYYKSVTVIPPTNATQFAIIFQYIGVGTAGANDYFDISDIQLERSPFPTPYQYKDFAEAYWETNFFYFKSFNYEIAPAQNAGANTGEQIFIATRAGAVTIRSPTIRHSRPMRLNDLVNITLYNPEAANDQIRDATANADTTDATIISYNAKGFNVRCTGDASTAVGDSLSLHYTKDDRLY